MINKKKQACKTGALCLAGVLAISMTGATVYAKNGGSEKKETELKQQIEDAVDNIWTSSDDDTTSKDETVYVILGADGETKKVIVSDWIKNNTKETSLEDVSELSDVKAVKNGEDYTLEDGKLIWSTDGNDVYYQGSIDKELPVTMEVSYTLDGKEISAKELAGKSGHVQIKYEFTNHLYENRTIAGKSEKIYVPFAVMTGMILENEQFSNVTVSTGKILNDGAKCVVTGITFPGLAENLKREELSNSLEIEADVTDFSLESTYCIATNSVFGNLNLSDLNDLGDLQDALDDLNDASIQLMDGSSDLYDGVAELYDKSGELVDGVKTLQKGASDLSDGADKLASGAGQVRDGAGKLASGASSLQSGTKSLQSGANDLVSGLNTLASKNGDLTEAAAQVFDILLQTANEQLNANEQLKALGIQANMTRDTYAEFLNGLLNQLGGSAADAVRAQVEQAVNAQEATIRVAVTQAVEAQVRSKVIATIGTQVPSFTEDVYNQVKAAGTVSNGDAGMDATIMGLVAKVDQTVAAQMASDEVKATIEQNVTAVKNQKIEENVAAQLANVNKGAAQIASLKASLDNYNTFYQGLITYTNGVAEAGAGAGKLAAGAGRLVDGSNQLVKGTGDLVGGMDSLVSGAGSLAQGTKTLKGGVNTLADGSDALIDGVGQLKDGALALKDGMATFDEEGISKLTSLDTTEVQELIDRLKATAEVAANYNSFSGIADNMDGNVKFIYKLAEIK